MSFTGGREEGRGISSCSPSLHDSSPLTPGLFRGRFPRTRGLPHWPRCQYRKVVFRLIDSRISSHGQRVEDYTSCFKNHLCYRLVFKDSLRNVCFFLSSATGKRISREGPSATPISVKAGTGGQGTGLTVPTGAPFFSDQNCVSLLPPEGLSQLLPLGLWRGFKIPTLSEFLPWPALAIGDAPLNVGKQ